MKKTITFLLLLVAIVTTQAQNTFTSTTPGTTTWTCPADVTSVTIECWGAGGAGGSVQTTTDATITSRACGGAGGSYAKITLTNLVPGTAYTYTVGAGGAAAIPTQASVAASGGSTTFNTSTVFAVGGPGGSNLYNQASLGSLGLATAPVSGNTGDVVWYGGNGGVNGGTGAGAGGGSAGSTGNGGAGGTAANVGAAGAGGGGAGGAGSAAATGTGTSGSIPGGGGGGAVVKTTANTSRLAGSGANGKIVFNWITNVPSAPTITFPTATVNKNFGDAAFTQIASSNSNGVITYSSNNPSVASVDPSTGQVTLGSVGTATITADQAAGTGFLAGSTSYTVNVNAVITVSTPSPSQLFYEAGVTTSGEATFTITSLGLTNDVLVAPGTNVEVSLTSGSGFVANPSTLTIPLASFSGGPVTIYLRLRASIQPGGTGTVARTITVSSIGATTKTTVLGSGYITGLQITGSSPTSTYVQGAGPGDEKSFTVIGACLETTTQVLLTVGSNIEITTTAGNYTTPISSPVSLVITPGAIPNPRITTATYYYRLKAGLAAGTYADATTKVSLSADGSSSLTGAFTTKELQITGTVDLGTGLANRDISNLKCIAANGTIHVSGVEAGKQIDIYNNVGQKVKSLTAIDNNNISLSAKGIYFVKVDALVQKVILK
ncbi:MAG: glycine-rich domain-containing protein [Paludibacter sp.]